MEAPRGRGGRRVRGVENTLIGGKTSDGTFDGKKLYWELFRWYDFCWAMLRVIPDD